MPTLQDLPLPLAVIIAAFYIINSNNAEYAKKIVALLNEFTGKYEAIIKAMDDDRKESRERWVERDRQLSERLEKNTEAHVRNANETHALRNLVTPLVLSVEADRKRGRGTQSPRSTGGGNPDAAD